MISVAILAPGTMGSAIARRLNENDVEVLTSLAGRSAQTAERALSAGMTAVELFELARANLFLSIVPPGVAVAVAEEIGRVFAAQSRKPLYIDCNAINPETAARVATTVRNGGMDYVDGGIIGGPPKRNYDGPVLYLSGDRAGDAAVLDDFGLKCRILERGAFAASALKMSYAGITKGLTALASVMILGATRAGVADALGRELRHSQPMLLDWFGWQIPSMFPKAWRWIAEMEEIAAFLDAGNGHDALFRAVAEFYVGIAGERSAEEVESLSRFFGPKQAHSG